MVITAPFKKLDYIQNVDPDLESAPFDAEIHLSACCDRGHRPLFAFIFQQLLPTHQTKSFNL